MQSGARQASIILGVFMAVVLVAGALLPLFSQNTGTTQTIEPTTAPIPTFPPPISDLSTISFDQYYLHPTGLYIIAQPTGFQVSQPSSAPSIAQVNMVNSEALSVIDAYVEDPLGPITAADLDGRFNAATLAASWARFSNWTELSRRMEGDTLLIDFEVDLQRQIYVARQRVWTDGEWIYVVRVLAPENATDFLVTVLDQLVENFVPFKFFAGTPFEWQAYYDHVLSHIIRYPAGWVVVDSAPGRPASITGTNGEALRVEALPNTTVADEDAASAWVERLRSGTTILSVVPVDHEDASGFSVAYTFTTVDGAPQSGLAVLLNDADETLHVANLRFPAENVDLNAIEAVEVVPEIEVTAEVTPEATDEAEATAEFTPETADQTEFLMSALYRDLALSMRTFHLMPPLNLSIDALPEQTPTPLPTPVPVGEATAEAEETDIVEEVATEAPEAVETEAPVEEDATEEAVVEATASNFGGLAATATALAESRQTPTAAP